MREIQVCLEGFVPLQILKNETKEFQRIGSFFFDPDTVPLFVCVKEIKSKGALTGKKLEL